MIDFILKELLADRISDGVAKCEIEEIIRKAVQEERETLKEILKLNNWFTAHLLSAYKKADKQTKQHIDNLYIEFNKRWKEAIRARGDEYKCAD